MHRYKKLLLSSFMSLAGAQALATPVINPDYTTNINVPFGYEGSRWFYGENINDLYVAPPDEGSVTLNNYAPQNASYCEDLAIVRASEQNANTTLVLLSEQLLALIVDYGLYEFEMGPDGRPLLDDQNQPVFRLDADGNRIPTAFKLELDAAALEASEAEATMDLAESTWLSARDVEREAEREKDDRKDDLDDCRDDAEFEGEDWREYCELEYEDYQDARDAHRDARNAARDAEDAFYDAEFAFNRADEAYDALDGELTENIRQITDMKFAVESEQRFLSEMYNEIAGIYGGQLNMTYRTNWDDMIAAYSLVNPSKNIRRVPLYNPVVSVAVPPDVLVNNPGLARAPGLAWSFLNIAGIGASQDFTTMPDGTDTVIEDNRLNGWADSFQGQTGLLLRSSCAMIEGTEGLTGSALFDAYSQRFSEYLAPAVSYSYDVRANVAYEATYNLSEFMKIVKTVTKRRGFFNSSTKNEVVNEFENSQAFEMTFTADAINDKFTDEDKAELTEIVRARLLRDVMDAAGRREMMEDPNLDFVPVPDSFADEFSGRLRGTCKYGWGFRCWGGWVFYGIGSIWGGTSTAMNSYEQSNDFTSSESVTDYFFVNYDGAINFPAPQQ